MNKVKVAIISLVTLVLVFLGNFLKREGYETTFTSKKWVLRKENIVFTGVITKAFLYWGDGDMNIFVRPNEEFHDLLVNRMGGWNQDGLIECEVEVLDDYELQYSHFLEPLIGKQIGVSGVFVDDRENPDKTEVHSINVIVGVLDSKYYNYEIKTFVDRLDGQSVVYRVLAASDDSWFQHPQLSSKTLSTDLCLKPAHTIIEGEYSYPKSFRSTSLQIKTIVKEFSNDFNDLCFKIEPLSYAEGGPGVWLEDVIIYQERKLP